MPFTSLCPQRRTVLAFGVLSTGLAAMGVRAQAPLKVGVIYNTPIADVGWNFQHHSGIQAMEKACPGKVKIQFVENVAEGPDAERVIRSLVQNGNQLIFTPSFGYMEPTLRVAADFPKVTFANGTGYKQGANFEIVPMNAAVPADVQAKLRALEANLKAGKLMPFGGQFKDNDGKDIANAGAGLSDADIGGMNYDVAGVVGKVPK